MNYIYSVLRFLKVQNFIYYIILQYNVINEHNSLINIVATLTGRERLLYTRNDCFSIKIINFPGTQYNIVSITDSDLKKNKHLGMLPLPLFVVSILQGHKSTSYVLISCTLQIYVQCFT